VSDFECICTDDKQCYYHASQNPDHPDMIRKKKEEQEFRTQAAMDLLGITEDQLRIARSLDRKKIMNLRSFLSATATITGIDVTHFLLWLPTFEEKKCEHEYVGRGENGFICVKCGEEKKCEHTEDGFRMRSDNEPLDKAWKCMKCGEEKS